MKMFRDKYQNDLFMNAIGDHVKLNDQYDDEFSNMIKDLNQPDSEDEFKHQLDEKVENKNQFYDKMNEEDSMKSVDLNNDE